MHVDYSSAYIDANKLTMLLLLIGAQCSKFHAYTCMQSNMQLWSKINARITDLHMRTLLTPSTYTLSSMHANGIVEHDYLICIPHILHLDVTGTL